MIEIIPAILTDSDEELVRLAHVFTRIGAKRIQLDICDGVFVPNRTINGYDQLNRLVSTEAGLTECVAKFDVHLMVQHPEEQCGHWATVTCADRFLIHIEAAQDLGMLCEHATSAGKTIGAAINPETPLEKLEAAVQHVNIVQFLTVHPGAQGKAFVPEVLEKIRTFHTAHPDITIMVDGGVTPETAPQCVAAGALVLVVGSYLVRAPDTAQAFKELQQAIL